MDSCSDNVVDLFNFLITEEPAKPWAKRWSFDLFFVYT